MSDGDFATREYVDRRAVEAREHADARVAGVEGLVAARLEDVQRQLDLRFTAADRALQALARENRDDHQVVTEGLREGREAQQRTADALSSLQVTVAGMSASGAARSTFFEQALKVIGAVTAALALLVSLVGVVVAVVSAVS